jgi:hypothetical protein
MVDAWDVRYEYDTAGQLRRIVDAGANQITDTPMTRWADMSGNP